MIWFGIAIAIGLGVVLLLGPGLNAFLDWVGRNR